LKLTQGEKSERSRTAILQAALRLFSKQGYRGTSIREIAAEAGLSTGNVYHHFPDKEALFTTLLGQYWEAIASRDFPFPTTWRPWPGPPRRACVPTVPTWP
jgi:AcrR family transcriptional regulator